jgi:hypothetical protein
LLGYPSLQTVSILIKVKVKIAIFRLDNGLAVNSLWRAIAEVKQLWSVIGWVGQHLSLSSMDIVNGDFSVNSAYA